MLLKIITAGTRKPGGSTVFCAQTLSEESCSPRSTDKNLQAHRRDKIQPETTIPKNTRDNQMAKSKHKNPTNRNQATWQYQSPVLPPQQSWIPQHSGKARVGYKSHLMMLIKYLKNDINNSLKEIWENMG